VYSYSQLKEHDPTTGFAQWHYGKEAEVVHYSWVQVILTSRTWGCLAKTW